jgi:HK97 gp10 family phage protein
VINVKVKVVKNDVGKIARQLSRRVADATGETIADLETEIKQHITAVGAVDTGLMLNSTQGEHRGDEGDVTNATDYWPYVNYGSQGRPARPFVEPAVDIVQPRHVERIRKALDA